MLIIHWFPNTTFAILFTLSFLIWIALEFVNHIVGKGERLGQFNQRSDKGSYWFLLIMALLSLWLAFVGRLLPWGLWPDSVQYVGLLLMLSGIALREWAVVVLGQYFSVMVSIETNHQLITNGPYHKVRHPAYSGALLAMIGFQLTLGTGVTLLLALILLIPAFMYRIKVEEQVLLATFGEVYQAYQQRTWRLFPGW